MTEDDIKAIEALRRAIAKIRVEIPATEFDIHNTIMCGGAATLEDAAQIGFAAACMLWDRRLEELLPTPRERQVLSGCAVRAEIQRDIYHD